MARRLKELDDALSGLVKAIRDALLPVVERLNGWLERRRR